MDWTWKMHPSIAVEGVKSGLVDFIYPIIFFGAKIKLIILTKVVVIYLPS